MNYPKTTKFIQIGIFFFTCLLIIFWLYLQVVKKIRFVFFTEQYLVYFQLFFITFFLIFILLSIQNILLLIFKQRKKEQKTYNAAFFSNIRHFIDKINIFFKSYVILFEYLGPGSKIATSLITLSKYVMKLIPKKRAIIYSCFLLIPRSIILFVFLFEIGFGQLHYYFYTLYLLIIPLLFRILIFALNDIGPRLTPEVNSMVDLYIQDDLKHVKVLLKPEFNDISPLHFFNNFYIPITTIQTFMSNYILPEYLKYNLVSLWIYYLIHVLGLSYILYCI